MYDLASTGVADAKRQLPLEKQKFAYQPLSGLVDGANKLFRIEHYPIETGSLTIYVDMVAQDASTYAVDLETGTVVFSAAPTAPVLATYTYAELTDAQIIDLLKNGLSVMETFWTRQWVVYISGEAQYVAAPNGTGYFDPKIGATTFSQSVAAQHIFFLCAQYSLVLQRATKAANSALSYSQDSGISVDNRQQAKDLSALLAPIEKRIRDAIQDLLSVLDGDEYGAYIAPTHSQTYERVFKWQDKSIPGTGPEV